MAASVWPIRLPWSAAVRSDRGRYMAGRFQETRSDALLHTMAATLIIAGAAAFLVTGGSASAVAVRPWAEQHSELISRSMPRETTHRSTLSTSPQSHSQCSTPSCLRLN